MVPTNYHNYRSIGISLLLLSFFAIIQCSGGGTEVGNPSINASCDSSTSLEAFENNDELEAYLKVQYARCVLPQSLYGTDMNQTDDMLDTGDTASNSAGEAANDTSEETAAYSDTNNQETGVAEADKVKTDGRYFYIAGDQCIFIVDAHDPAAMVNIKTISIDGTVSAIHLYGNLLIVLYKPLNHEGNANTMINLEEPVRIGMPYWIPVKAQTGVRVFDIIDPADPHILKDTIVDGDLISTRRINDKLHVIQRFLPELPALQYTYDGTESDWHATISQNSELLDDLSLDDMVPLYQSTDGEGQHTSSGKLISPQNYYRPLNSGGASTVIITTFNLSKTDLPFVSKGIFADAETVYASQNSLYIAATEWNYYQSFDSNTARPVQTIIHKFDLSGDEVILKGSGRISGRILNQFSLGENGRTLNIATTIEDLWQNNAVATSSNQVYCLQETDEGLGIKGEINDIAPGEHLYSARFVGDRGFLITFVKVDPLITLDLSNPAAPKIVGELKVPGFSEYIHPIGDTMLLTIGKDTKLQNDTAWYQGVQLSLFDIEDFADPVLSQYEIIGDRGTHSEALYNHKAFTYWDTQNLLAVPIDLYQYSASPSYYYENGEYVSSGLYVYHLTEATGFELLGSIRTSSDSSPYDDYQGWTRGIFIDQYVFAVQAHSLYSAKTDDIEHTIVKLILEETVAGTAAVSNSSGGS